MICLSGEARTEVYLEEYAPKNWVTDVIEINITNLYCDAPFPVGRIP
jgi:hypothetical protein